eukprot:SAG31_NODE_685_length_12832_cov_28.355376_8_plen_240_part_00
MVALTAKTLPGYCTIKFGRYKTKQSNTTHGCHYLKIRLSLQDTELRRHGLSTAYTSDFQFEVLMQIKQYVARHGHRWNQKMLHRIMRNVTTRLLCRSKGWLTKEYSTKGNRSTRPFRTGIIICPCCSKFCSECEPEHKWNLHMCCQHNQSTGCSSPSLRGRPVSELCRRRPGTAESAAAGLRAQVRKRLLDWKRLWWCCTVRARDICGVQKELRWVLGGAVLVRQSRRTILAPLSTTGQ